MGFVRTFKMVTFPTVTIIESEKRTDSLAEAASTVSSDIAETDVIHESVLTATAHKD
jgi:hypothetical protein